MKLLKEQGDKKVKVPAATVSGLNWTVATQLQAFPRRMEEFLQASNNGDAWVDAICSLGLVEQKDA